MVTQDLKRMFDEIEIPDPDEAAKKAAIAAAVAEFKRQNPTATQNTAQKGREPSSTRSLAAGIQTLGNRFMAKPYVVSGGVAACIVLLAISTMYLSLHDAGNRSESVILSAADSGPQPLEIAKISPAPVSAPSLRDAAANAAVEIEQRPSPIVAKESRPVEVAPPSGDPKTSQSPQPPGVGVSNQKRRVATSRVENEKSSTVAEQNRRRKGKSAAIAAIAHPVPPQSSSVEPAKAYSPPSSFKSRRPTTATLQGRMPRKHSNGGLVQTTTTKPNGWVGRSPKTGEPRASGLEYSGRDTFETTTPNPVTLVSREPVATFSIDVDTASYSFVRKMLNHGVLPPKNSVRIEELINYFDYNYALAKDKKLPFKPTIAIYPTPWNSSTKLLHIGIKGYSIVPDQRPRANLVFLIDTSGSMASPDKLPLAKNAIRLLVDTLDAEDTISIVVYAGQAAIALLPTPAKKKGVIRAALTRMRAGGSTAGGAALQQAYALAAEGFVKDGVNRIILATDGDFNVGIYNPEKLKGYIERKRRTGVCLSVLGFGKGNYNDELMQKMAQAGNGNASYIDNLNEARKVLVQEAGSTLFSIAKDVKIQIEFNPKMVAEYRLIGYETRLLKREDFNNDPVDAGDIGSGHSVTAIFEIAAPKSDARLIDDLRYSEGKPVKKRKRAFAEEYAFLKIRYKLPNASSSSLMTTPITVKHQYSDVRKVPAEIRFAASVAAFGQLLRGDPYTKNFTYDDVIRIAAPVLGKDEFGYRNEFVNLNRLAKSAMSMQSR
ncbi:MAG: DUF3520 domain-containing protein [Proteobacteria bacterium]|nr:DUF3520 domain-containing protein [Pseudomonadota bacterium]